MRHWENITRFSRVGPCPLAVGVGAMRAAQPGVSVTPTPVVRLGSLTLDATGYAVSVNGKDVFLTVSEFVLLRALAQQPYRVLERATLWTILQAGNGAEPASPAALRAIDRHVARLRKKLRGAGFDGIQTMRHVGYRLIPDVESSSAVPSSGRRTATGPVR